MIKKSGSNYRLVANKKNDSLLLINGGPVTEPFTVEEDQVCTLQFGSTPLVVFVGKDPKAWADQITRDRWEVVNGRSGGTLGQTNLYGIPDLIREMGASFEDCAIKPVGLDVAFWVVSMIDALSPPDEEIDDEIEQEYQAPVVVDPDRGEFTCPICWLKFDRPDVLSIAIHDDLRGDPKLGDDAMLRFVPTEFNSKGQALDPMGLPTTDGACPHCHRKMPPGFMDVPHHIFSIVGAPSSGKSYYLSVLVRQANTTLIRRLLASHFPAFPALSLATERDTMGMRSWTERTDSTMLIGKWFHRDRQILVVIHLCAPRPSRRLPRTTSRLPMSRQLAGFTRSPTSKGRSCYNTLMVRLNFRK